MINKIINYIANSVASLNNGFFNSYDAGVYKIPEKIVKGFGFDKEDSGIIDFKNRHFYIRYNGKISILAPKKQVTSCTNQIRLSIPLKLIAYHIADIPVNCVVLCEKIKSDLLNIDFNSYTEKENEYNFNIELNSMNFISHEIIIEETGKKIEELQIDGNISICSIDFILSYDFIGNSSCIDLCENLKHC